MSLNRGENNAETYLRYNSDVSFLLWSADAQLVTRKDLTADLAVTMAPAISACKAQGRNVSATIVGRAGEVIVQIRGDGAGPSKMVHAALLLLMLEAVITDLVHHQPEAQHPISSAIHKPPADYPIYWPPYRTFSQPRFRIGFMSARPSHLVL